jgi:fatty acid desaturase
MLLEQQRDDPASPGQLRGVVREASDIAELSPGLVAYNLGYLVLVWATAFGVLALFWAHPAWYTFTLAFVVVSSRQHALLNCEHECIHGKLVPDRRWNERIGRYLCAAPLGSPFSASRARHLTHHRHLGTPEDPDRELHAGEDYETRRGMVRHFARGLLGAYAGMVLMGPPRDERTPPGLTGSNRRDAISLALGQAFIGAGLWLAFDWWVYPALWLAPLASATLLAHLLRSFAEHAVTAGEMPHHHNRLITIHSNPLERFVMSPYFMNYHAEHHLIPSVPAPRLKVLQRRLADQGGLPPVLERSSYSGAIRRYVRSLSR